MPIHLRNASTQIECKSRIFFFASTSDGVILIQGWSNAAIPSGLIAMLYNIFNGCLVAELGSTKISFLAETGLADNLTGQRKAALNEMLNQIFRI